MTSACEKRLAFIIGINYNGQNVTVVCVVHSSYSGTKDLKSLNRKYSGIFDDKNV